MRLRISLPVSRQVPSELPFSDSELELMNAPTLIVPPPPPPLRRRGRQKQEAQFSLAESLLSAPSGSGLATGSRYPSSEPNPSTLAESRQPPPPARRKKRRAGASATASPLESANESLFETATDADEQLLDGATVTQWETQSLRQKKRRWLALAFWRPK